MLPAGTSLEAPHGMHPYWYQYAVVLVLLALGYKRWRRLGDERGFFGAYLVCFVSMTLFTEVLGEFAHVREHDDTWMTILRLGITIACCLYAEIWIRAAYVEPVVVPAARALRSPKCRTRRSVISTT